MTSLVRADSRNTTSIRPFQCHHGLLHRADGSARFSAGKTNVVCGVYGPTDVRSRDEMVDRATIEVVFKQPTGLPTPREKWIEEALARALDALILTQLHPRTLIQVAVQAVQNDGALFSTTLNAACLALMSAGIPLRSAFTAVTLAVVPNPDDQTDGEHVVVIDPTLDEERDALSTHVFVLGASDDGDEPSPIYSVQSEGDFTMDQFEQCAGLASRTATVVLAHMAKAMASPPSSSS